MASNVDYDAFLEWAQNRFGPENIRFKKGGKEICTHSMFKEDRKFHLWMNPEGGFKEKQGGAFRCWKSDRMGTLVDLVAELDKIPFDQAEELICTCPSLRALEMRLDTYFDSKPEAVEVKKTDTFLNLKLPPHTMLIDELPDGSVWKEQATTYLQARSLPTEGYYVCDYGDYINRIIIPYYDAYGRLIFYNGRTMSQRDEVLRYLKAKGDGLLQENIIYFWKWPKPGAKVYVIEGEFDVRSVYLAGLNACAIGGKSISDAQVEILRDYIPVLALDTDKEDSDVGLEALIGIGNKLLEKGFKEVHYVRPPRIYKDWNKVLQMKNAATIKAYIEKNERRFTSMTASHLRNGNLL